MISGKDLIFWTLLPICNFYLWFSLGREDMLFQLGGLGLETSKKSCPDYSISEQIFEAPCPPKAKKIRRIRAELPPEGGYQVEDAPSIQIVDSKEFGEYRTEDLVAQNYFGWTTQINAYPEEECVTYINTVTSRRQMCTAVIRAKVDSAYKLVRFDKEPKLGGRLKSGHIMPTGFFREVSALKGRTRLMEKAGPFFTYLPVIQGHLQDILKSRGRKKGDDLVVMVVNDGEIDLFYNFACSCRFHGFDLSSVLVFAGSIEIVPLIEATGAMGFFHSNFAQVSRDPSYGYLDRIFVDMMWYKAFSVWLTLREGYNVLFQDVDLVWFRDPFPYFKDYIASAKAQSPTGDHPDAFFSDDGQRGLRYSPFYANSGFYYLLANKRTEHFAWGVITAFDILTTTGSHQNVFTMRLVEGLFLNRIHTKLLSLDDFPTGIQFHHNPDYMAQLRNGTQKPYNFHMCWTLNKGDKLRNFLNASMWYMSDSCDLKSFNRRTGKTYKYVLELSRSRRDRDAGEKWNLVSDRCCELMPGAP